MAIGIVDTSLGIQKTLDRMMKETLRIPPLDVIVIPPHPRLTDIDIVSAGGSMMDDGRLSSVYV